MVFYDPEAELIYGGDDWVSKPYTFGVYTGWAAAVEAGWTGTLAEWVADDPANAATFEAEDLTAYTGWSALWRPTADDETTIIELTIDDSLFDEGQLSVSADPEATRLMNGPGTWDAQATSPRVRTFVRAKTTWDLDVTR